MQSYALEIAKATMDMMGNEYKGKFYFKSYGGGSIESIEVELFFAKFYLRHVTVTSQLLGTKKLKQAIYFDIEEKIYSDGTHNTKITIQSGQSMVMKFLAELMGDIKPIKPDFRFSLKQFVEQKPPEN